MFLGLILKAGGVAGNTIGKITDSFFQMFFADIGFCVLMTAIAGVFRIGLRVAGATFCGAAPAVIQGEGMLRQGSGRPGGGAVAAYAVGTKLAQVHIRFGVAPFTGVGRAAELAIIVAGNTGSGGVGTIQHKNLGMVEGGHCVLAVVAGQAVRAKEGVVVGHEGGIGLGMAGGAIYGVGAEGLGLVAIGTAHGGVDVGGLVAGEAEVGAFFVIKLA